MKTIKDLKSHHINKIYSLIYGKERVAGKIDWTPEKDFVVAIFKTEECTINNDYDTIEYGIQINENLEVNHVWYWKNKMGTAIDSQTLYNHHAITKYLLDEGFELNAYTNTEQINEELLREAFNVGQQWVKDISEDKTPLSFNEWLKDLKIIKQ